VPLYVACPCIKRTLCMAGLVHAVKWPRLCCGLPSIFAVLYAQGALHCAGQLLSRGRQVMPPRARANRPTQRQLTATWCCKAQLSVTQLEVQSSDIVMSLCCKGGRQGEAGVHRRVLRRQPAGQRPHTGRALVAALVKLLRCSVAGCAAYTMAAKKCQRLQAWMVAGRQAGVNSSSCRHQTPHGAG
jgi:hypothetical protein